MTTTQERRYRVCEQPVGTGRDLLLDRAVTTVRLAHDRPERLARALRSRGAGPWLHVLDAFEQDGEVVAVLPAHTGMFSEQLPHLSGDDAEALATGLQSALDELAAHGLSVLTLDPARIATTDDGQPVLVPVTGTGSTTAAMAPLLAVLGGVPAADASTMGDEHRVPAALDTVPIDAASADTQVIDTSGLRKQVIDLRDGVQPHAARPAPPRPGLPGPALPRPALTRPAVHVPEAAVPVRFPRPGLTEAETGRRPSAGWPRTTALSLGAAALVLGTGLLLTSQGDDVDDGLRAGRTASASAPQASAPFAALVAVQRDLEADPTAVGPGGGDLLQRLRLVDAGQGGARAFAAAGVVEAVRIGRARETLAGPLVDRSEQAALILARPADLAGLISTTSVDPGAFGTRAPRLLGRLTALQSMTGEAARAEAQELWSIVLAGPARGELTATYAGLAVPVLRGLAVPPDLSALIAVTAVEPARFGPRTPKFAGRLNALQALTGEPARIEAAALASIVQAGVAKGEFTPAFRDIALPVLRPLARPA